MRKQYAQPQVKRFSRTLLALVFALVLPVVVLVLSLRWVNPPATAFMLQQSDANQRAYSWVSLQEISDSAILAVVAAEDQRFTDHAGIDFDSIEKALDDAEAGRNLRGASTITQQLAKNLFLWPGKNVFRKGVEAMLSVLLDALLPKARIMELYLNVIELGPGVYGVGAASKIFFGITPAQLGDGDAALLAAVLPNPKKLSVARPSEYVLERRGWILEQMGRLRREGAVLAAVRN